MRTVLSAGLIAAILTACSAPYQSSAQIDPMTGELVSRIAYIRLNPVEGQTSVGQHMITGSAEGIAMTEVVGSHDRLSFQVSHVSSYGNGLMAGGQASSCVDETLRVNIDGTLIEVPATGQVRQRGYVTQRTWGQATGGSQAVSQGFELTGGDFDALMHAQRVLIEYCDIVGEISEVSLLELQRGVVGSSLPLEASAQEFATQCDEGNGGSCYLLGRAFMSGSAGVRQNAEVGCSAFRAACDAGNSAGCTAIQAECSGLQ